MAGRINVELEIGGEMHAACSMQPAWSDGVLSSASHCLCIAFWKQFHAIASNRIMKSTKIWLIIVIVLVVISLVVVTDEALSWGTFLGANWKKGEGEVED
jgi:hypothetical protein